ncbi:MAG: oxygenase [Gammaproteobacteria bacterium]|nr:oxygenase [Gammaproteobacteria bacterium]
MNSKVDAVPSRQKLATDWLPSNFDLRDTWFAVAHANHVSARPIKRVMHARQCYVWRENGTPVVAEFHPLHMAAMKSEYSEFTAGSGYFPVAERYGYVWVWYGNPANATLDLLPQIPFLPRDGSSIPAYMRTTVRFDGCSPLSVENLLDLTHADFLHGEVVGGEGEAESDEVEYSHTSETLTRTRIVTHKPVSPVMRWVGGVRAKYQDFRSTLHVHLRSNLCISYPRFRPGFDIPNVQPFVPSGKYRSRVNQIFNLQAAPLPFRHIMPRMAYVVGPQDNSVVRPQTPVYLSDNAPRDLHSRFDGPGARYRLLMKKLWERQQNGDFSYAGDADPGADIAALLGMDRALE